MEPVDSPQGLPSYHLFSPPAGETDDSERKRAWKGDSFSFGDVLDLINPLQHLPVVGTLYRWITGDTIGAVPRMIGDALYGGPIGFVTGLVNAVVKQESGKDVGEQVIAMLGGDQSSPAADPKTIAANGAQPAASPQATPVTATISGAGVASSVPAAAAILGALPAPGQATAASAGSPAPASPPDISAANLTARSGTRVAPALPVAADADPRAAFLARTSALHRQLAADNGQLPGRALSNKVVPLQGIALPPGLLRASAPGGVRAAGAMGAADISAVPGLPSNPPTDISQQMMDALDKYTRLQQQRDANHGAGRGTQVDFAQ